MSHTQLTCSLLAAAALLAACGPTEQSLVPPAKLAALSTTPVEPAAPSGLDTATESARVALGKQLYHDKRLSGDGTISCATCHSLDTFGVDNKPTSTGIGGQLGARNAPTSLNAYLQIAQFWDGREPTVEAQALGPIMNPIEHGVAKEDDAVATLGDDPTMTAAFAAAFPKSDKPLTFTNIGAAIGAFERTLTTHSRFDDFLAGDHSALTAAEQQGLVDFVDTGCTMCHTSTMVGGQMYQKLGLVKPYPTDDLGRFEATGVETDKHFFKVPTLLNIEKTGPYMHDGSITSLDEMVRIMAEYQLGQKLDDAKVTSIATFLRSLTGQLPN